MSELELESDVWLSQKGEIMGTFVALRMLQTIVNNEMNGSFPNVYICLRIYLPLLVKNCSRGRSLSALNVLRKENGKVAGRGRRYEGPTEARSLGPCHGLIRPCFHSFASRVGLCFDR